MARLIKSFVFLLASFITANSVAQSNYLVFLEDKGEFKEVEARNCLSERSIEKRLSNDLLIDINDQRLNSDYLKKLAEWGQINKRSKWLNAVQYTSHLKKEQLNAFPFVKDVIELTNSKATENSKPIPEENKDIEYGQAQPFIDQLNIECLHEQGFLGEDIIIAVLDAGYRGMDTIPAFDSLYIENRVLDVFDFVDGDQEVYEKSTHGTRVSSIIAANQIDYVGAAPKASLCLYITEDVSHEVNQEEFDLVLGLERADSVGADLVNISLGYFDFDSLQTDYIFDDLDGHTTISTLGIQIAVDKGILVVTSAGNSGPSHITTPCDADSILCVGATNPQNELAGFSSVGPTSDFRIKPDISAMGASMANVNSNGTIGFGSGTSFSSPLACGMTALLVQSHPDLSIFDIMEGVKMSGHQANTPDNLFGYGIPDACLADSILNEIDIPSSLFEPEDSPFTVFPNPSGGNIRIQSKELIEEIAVFSIEGKLIENRYEINSFISEIDLGENSRGVYLLRMNREFWSRLILN